MKVTTLPRTQSLIRSRKAFSAFRTPDLPHASGCGAPGLCPPRRLPGPPLAARGLSVAACLSCSVTMMQASRSNEISSVCGNVLYFSICRRANYVSACNTPSPSRDVGRGAELPLVLGQLLVACLQRQPLLPQLPAELLRALLLREDALGKPVLEEKLPKKTIGKHGKKTSLIFEGHGEAWKVLPLVRLGVVPPFRKQTKVALFEAPAVWDPASICTFAEVAQPPTQHALKNQTRTAVP